MKRLQIGQVLILSLWIGPLSWMLWLLRRFLIPEVEEALAHPDQTWLQNFSILRYFPGTKWSAFLLPIATAGICLTVWGYAIVRNRDWPVSQHGLVRAAIWVSYVSALATTLLVAIFGNLCLKSLEGHRDIYAGWVAHAGVMSGQPRLPNKYSLQTSRLVAPPSKLTNPNSAFAFYCQRIGDETISPVVARHLVGSLITLLKAETEGTWPDIEPLELEDLTVQGIMRLSGQNFSLPSKPFERVATEFSLIDQVGEAIGAASEFGAQHLHRLRSDSDRKTTTVKELVEWWNTVADQPEWEALPFYEIDNHATANDFVE